ncbi:hypothetical protein [Nonomuraea turcica]|uniref:hypothetical protein n=1 Tax=Nonomuraea sp. G32 TaxID=3067274 RepID=UPI00273CDF20|nr:hypothetical protein [Nonomuraea sp. G32]MDP4512155.1 hypothetical protein [Nonomuraea sp. G32]
MTRADGQEPDPGTWLLDKIEAREQAVAGQIERTRAEIDTLTARLRDLDEAAEHLRITRKTLLSLADEPETDTTPPAPVIPDHPAYRQILNIFGDLGRPLRARDLCQTLDLPIVPKNTEKIRAKLKRLVGQGILVETEPGLFAQPRP